MKTRFLILLFAFSMLFPISDIFAPPPPDHQHAFNYSEHVIIGKILSVEVLSEPRVTKTETSYSEQAGIVLYEIDVEKYLKNPLYTNTMKVPGYFSYNYDEPQNVIESLYEVNEKVFLYIQPDSHETLVDYDLIIRSYESRSLDRTGSICDNSDTFYYEGECKEIPDCPPNTIFADGVCNLIESPSMSPTREESTLFALSIIINLCIAFSLPIIGVVYFLKKKKHRVKVLFSLIGIAIFAFLGLTIGFLRFGAEA